MYIFTLSQESVKYLGGVYFDLIVLEFALESPDLDVIDLESRALAVPGGEPLLLVVVEVGGGLRWVVLPGLGARGVDRVVGEVAVVRQSSDVNYLILKPLVLIFIYADHWVLRFINNFLRQSSDVNRSI